MLTSEGVMALLDRLGIPQDGRELILAARLNAPVREVQFKGGNIHIKYPSAKMQRIIETESRSAEFRAALLFEFEEEVLEYYPQPCELDVWFTTQGTGINCRTRHTPDFLKITNDRISLLELKQTSKLERLAKEQPERYRHDGTRWSSPQMESYLAPMGIGYEVIAAEDLPSLFIENIDFLAGYLNEAAPPVTPEALSALKAEFANRALVPLCEFVERARVEDPIDVLMNGQIFQGSIEIGGDAAYTTDDLYKAIAFRYLVFDLFNDDLADTNRAVVYRDEAAMVFYRLVAENEPPLPVSPTVSIEEGATVVYGDAPYRIAFVANEKVLLEGANHAPEFSVETLTRLHLEGQVTIIPKSRKGMGLAVRMDALPPRALEIAVQRSKWLELAKFAPGEVPRTKRTLQRWARIMRQAGESVAEQRLALASRHHNCGKNTKHLTKEHEDLIERIVRKYFNTPVNLSKTAVFDFYVAECESLKVKPCTFKTFRARMLPFISDRDRLGKKGAYQRKAIVWYLEREDRIHGARPWQYVHFDHTQLEIFLRGTKSRKKLGKPWLSLAIDAESRMVLGFILSFEKPSYRSCMMLLRDLVRRHNRLPEYIILDNGAEFHGLAFSRFARLYDVTLVYRPPGESRFGTVIERFFGTTHTQLIRRLKGNTQLLRNPRAMSQSVHPDKQLAWTLYGLHGIFEAFLFEAYGKAPHPAHRDLEYETPMEHYIHRMIETGLRKHRLVRYDSQLLIESCPGPEHGDTRVIDSCRGIKIKHLYYQSTSFHFPSMHGKEVEVRVDPFDPRFVYAIVKNEWQRCVSKEASRLRNYTALERRYANERVKESIQKSGLHARPGRYSDLLKMYDPAKFDPILAEQQEEALRLYGPLRMTDARCLEEPVSGDGLPAIIQTLEVNQPTNTKPKKAIRLRSYHTLTHNQDDTTVDECAPEQARKERANVLPRL